MRYLINIDKKGRAVVDPDLYDIIILHARKMLKGTRGISSKKSRIKKKIFKKAFEQMIIDYIKEYGK